MEVKTPTKGGFTVIGPSPSQIQIFWRYLQIQTDSGSQTNINTPTFLGADDILPTRERPDLSLHTYSVYSSISGDLNIC